MLRPRSSGAGCTPCTYEVIFSVSRGGVAFTFEHATLCFSMRLGTGRRERHYHRGSARATAIASAPARNECFIWVDPLRAQSTAVALVSRAPHPIGAGNSVAPVAAILPIAVGGGPPVRSTFGRGKAPNRPTPRSSSPSCTSLLESGGYGPRSSFGRSHPRARRVSLATIYRLFPTRDDSVVTAIERWMSTNCYAELAPPRAYESLYDGLMRSLRYVFEPWERNPRVLEAYHRARRVPAAGSSTGRA